MDIQVTGQNIDTGEALQNRVRTKIKSLAEKYYENAISAHVTFVEEHSFIECRISTHFMQESDFHSQGQARIANEAFDLAYTRLSKQIRRHMRRLKDRQATKEKFAV